MSGYVVVLSIVEDSVTVVIVVVCIAVVVI